MNNEPAFPTHNGLATHQLSGMTLRDYFAAKAMAALYNSTYEYEFTGTNREPQYVKLMKELAVDAYEMADAMMEARK